MSGTVTPQPSGNPDRRRHSVRIAPDRNSSRIRWEDRELVVYCRSFIHWRSKKQVFPKRSKYFRFVITRR
jgi:hypothetical protein